MKRTRATILLVSVGVLVFLGIVGLSLGAWFFAAAFEREPATATAAVRSFDEVRRRFGDSGPVIEILDGDQARIRREPPAVSPARHLEHLQVLVWNSGDQRMVHVTLPFWLLRMKAGPIDLASHVSIRQGTTDVTVEQIERYGPALLIDHEDTGGDRVLLWTE
jgi:hypothetical protein